MQLTPVLSQNLGVFSNSMGSEQLPSDGNNFFLPAEVCIVSKVNSYAIELLPTIATGAGTQVLNVQGPNRTAAWRMHNVYTHGGRAKFTISRRTSRYTLPRIYRIRPSAGPSEELKQWQVSVCTVSPV